MMQEDPFRQAVALARTGQKDEARALLEQVLRDNPRNEAAWLWYADCAPTLPERVRALETCLRIIPDARMARLGLEKLRQEMTARTESRAPSPVKPVSMIPERKAERLATPPEHRLPVQQFPVSASPSEMGTGLTQPIHAAKDDPVPQDEAAKPSAETTPTRQVPADKLQPSLADLEVLPGAAPEVVDIQETQIKEHKLPSPVKIFDREPPRAAEPNPFTVTPGEYPRATPHTPVIKPLKAQIDRRLERDLGLDVPLPPEPTQRIRVHPKQKTTSRGMFLLYIALASIGILGIVALLIGLIFSNR